MKEKAASAGTETARTNKSIFLNQRIYEFRDNSIISKNIIESKPESPLITNKQARIFSSAIASDIGKYIENHKLEFEAWLIKNQESPKQEKNLGDKRAV